MSNKPIEVVLSHFINPKKISSGYQVKCPVHDDKVESLSISQAEDGKVLLKCHAGCETEDIVSAIGLEIKDLFPANGNKKCKNNFKIIKTYDYTNENWKLLYQSCRMNQKGFRQRRPDGNGGWIWNLNGVKPIPYHLPRIKEAITNNQIIFIVEGEKDVESIENIGLYATCNSGGAGKWKKEYNQYFNGAKVVIIPDNDETGKRHAEQVAENLFGIAKSIKLFELPDLPEKGDVSDWINKGGTKEKLIKLVQETTVWILDESSDYDYVAEKILIMRRNDDKNDKLKDFEINAQVSRIVIDDLKERGNFYHDGFSPYVFLNAEKKLVEIQKDSVNCQLMLKYYGLNPTEKVYQYLIKELISEAFEQGKRTEVYKLAYYNPEKFTLYLFNFSNQIYRISPDLIDFVDNGTDCVLFLTDNIAQPFKSQDNYETCSLLKEIIIDKINFSQDLLSSDEKCLIFILWFFSIFFESIMPTKPILTIIGPKGSSKTTTLRKVGKVLIGKGFDVTPLPSDSKDFDAAVTNSAFVAIDNADTKCSWLNDTLATMATGGTIKRREYYTTNNMIEYQPRCFLAITSRTPCFRRDDVADRLLILNVEELNSKKAEKFFLDEVIKNRDTIMTEIIQHLQYVVRALKVGKDFDYSGIFRIADFADFAVKIARFSGVEETVMNIFTKLSREQSYFTLDGNPIFYLLSEWSTQNPGKEITNTELCAELSKLADEKNIVFPYKGKHQSFARRMTNLRSNLAEFFEITERPAGGHKKKFTFSLKAG